MLVSCCVSFWSTASLPSVFPPLLSLLSPPFLFLRWGLEFQSWLSPWELRLFFFNFCITMSNSFVIYVYIYLYTHCVHICIYTYIHTMYIYVYVLVAIMKSIIWSFLGGEGSFHCIQKYYWLLYVEFHILQLNWVNLFILIGLFFFWWGGEGIVPRVFYIWGPVIKKHRVALLFNVYPFISVT